MNFVCQRSIYETENIYNFVEGSFVKRSQAKPKLLHGFPWIFFFIFRLLVFDYLVFMNVYFYILSMQKYIFLTLRDLEQHLVKKPKERNPN